MSSGSCMIRFKIMATGENQTPDIWGKRSELIRVGGDRNGGGARGRVTPSPNSIYRPESVLI